MNSGAAEVAVALLSKFDFHPWLDVSTCSS